MTAPSVAPSSPVPSSPRSAPVEPSPDPSAKDHFDTQLQAAKARADSRERDSGSTHSARSPHSARSSDRTASGQARSTTPHEGSPADTEAAPLEPSARIGVTDVEPVAPQLVRAVSPPVAEGEETGQSTVEDSEATGEQAATALAALMLSLIGPAVAGALRGAEGGTGKGMDPATATASWGAGAGAAAATALLPSTDPICLAPSVMSSLLAARETLMPPVSEGVQASSPDPFGSIALPAPATNMAAPALPVLQVPSPAGTPAFADELGQHVAWLGGQSIKQARIQLRPEELGALDVKITVNHGRVDVVFHAQHPGAVTAVQQSLPQLEQMLAQHGLSLGNTEVGQQNQGNADGSSGDGRNTGSDGGDDLQPVDIPVRLRQMGLLDAFA